MVLKESFERARANLGWSSQSDFWQLFPFCFSPRPDEELSQYSWKRPYELSPDGEPQLYVDGTSRRDVIQGILGDCWLLSTCAAIAKREDLLHRVVPPHQVKPICIGFSWHIYLWSHQIYYKKLWFLLEPFLNLYENFS